MPSGNLMVGPGIVQDGAQPTDYTSNNLLCIPGNESFGVPDEQFNGVLDNPFAQPGQQMCSSNEAPFMQPFIHSEGSLNDLHAAGREIGNLLMDEQEAKSNGQRVIAAEHAPTTAPAMSVADSDSSSLLPSPPDSSTLVSPDVALPFDFMRVQPTNLVATSSKDSGFSDMGFSDAMTGMMSWDGAFDLDSCESTFQDHGGLLKSTVSSHCAPDFNSSLPETPVSDVQIGRLFDLEKFATGLMPSIVSPADSPSQQETNWLQVNFGER
jgi:hypothetical protein